MSGDMTVFAQNWQVFREHRPTGAYLPTGQLDGDCQACGQPWPCAPVREVITAHDTQVRPEGDDDAAAAAPPQAPTCRTFDVNGAPICQRPATFIVWGHLFDKRDKGPKCAEHLPQAHVAPGLGLAPPAIYQIPAIPTRDVHQRVQALRDYADFLDQTLTDLADCADDDDVSETRRWTAAIRARADQELSSTAWTPAAARPCDR